MTDTQTQTEVERVIAGLNAGTGFRPVAPEIAERAASLLASQSAEIERLKAERDEAQQWLGEEQARAEAAEAKLEEARKALEPSYFQSLVNRASEAAAKASIKFPQPNYVTLKIAEEAGEVVRGAVHYAENRMEWSEVEGEIVQLLAMLIRFVTEGDEVNGVIPPHGLALLSPEAKEGEGGVGVHPDDIAVDRFATSMKEKLRLSREVKGRGGWQDKNQCSREYLSELLLHHVYKGDPVDVANLAMMLHQRGERISPPSPEAKEKGNG